MAQQWGPQPYGPTLLASFAHMTRDVFGSDDQGKLLPRVLTFVVAAVPGCRSAGVTLWRDGGVVESIGSDADATELDDASAVDGPVLEALRDEYPVHVPCVGDPPRWPRFEAAASRLGVATALYHGMFAHAPDWTPLGVLSLYGAAPDAFTAEDEEFTLVVAAFLSTAMALAHRQEHVERREAALHRALGSRDVIGQAKGILMERQRLSAGDAFDLLRRVSQHMNRKLTEVAEHLTRTGELPS
jgi:GAF domain-containing protein